MVYDFELSAIGGWGRMDDVLLSYHPQGFESASPPCPSLILPLPSPLLLPFVAQQSSLSKAFIIHLDDLFEDMLERPQPAFLLLTQHILQVIDDILFTLTSESCSVTPIRLEDTVSSSSDARWHFCDVNSPMQPKCDSSTIVARGYQADASNTNRYVVLRQRLGFIGRES
jgi:hypothetical protein